MKRVAIGWVALASCGCMYLGDARSVDPSALDREPGWVTAGEVELIRQSSDRDCGAAALAMVCSYWGVPATTESVLASCPSTEEGIRAADLRDAARRAGLGAFVVHGTWADLEYEMRRGRPVIVGTVKRYATGDMTHYEVVVAVHPGRRLIVTLDPAAGWTRNTQEGFMEEWQPSERLMIVVFRMETPGADSP